MIKWFAENEIAANLLMFLLLITGFHFLNSKIPLEAFPEFEIDRITISVPFRGATPAEVEEGVIIKIEEAIQDLEGIKEIKSTASEGFGTVSIEINSDYLARNVLDDIKNRVDSINTFPLDIEKPNVKIAERKREVISVVVYGDASEKDIREIAENIKEDISNLPGVTQTAYSNIRPYEVTIEVPSIHLIKYHLTMEDISNAIKKSSLDLSGGLLKSDGGEFSIKTVGQAYFQKEFEKIIIKEHTNGSILYLSDIATITDEFEESPIQSLFNGKNSVEIQVFRVGQQNAMELSHTVQEYITAAQANMPPGVSLTFWRDRATIVKARLDTLWSSAIQGGILVFIVLALFLRIEVALWVCVGIPISFMGAFLTMPYTGVTINIFSLFAFILVLGIVVDDAIVTGENIYTHRKKGKSGLLAAIEGTKEVALPVTFGILTTIAAFIPLAMLEGRRAPLFAQLPLVIIPIMIFSMIESKLILPSHLSHLPDFKSQKEGHLLVRIQKNIAHFLELFTKKIYAPILNFLLAFRYVTLAVFIGIALLIAAWVKSGHIKFTFFPRVQSEVARASLTMPYGTDFSLTQRYITKINDAAKALQKKYIDPKTNQSIILNISSVAGSSDSDNSGSHVGNVQFEVLAPEKRTLSITSSDLVNEWRKAIGLLPGVKDLNFKSEIGRGGDPIDVQLSGNDMKQLENLSQDIKAWLGKFSGVFDITDTFDSNKEEIHIHLKEEGKLLGLTTQSISMQIRNAYFGAQAQRLQRGKDDVRVMVKLPSHERKSIQNLQSLNIKTPSGALVHLNQVADLEWAKGFDKISRVNRQRTINIRADINKETVELDDLKKQLENHLQKILISHPNIRYTMEGEAREQAESNSSLNKGIIFILFCIYALLAIPLKSYLQPFIVMSVIPFGVIGALLGHFIMGMGLSIFSVFGILALMGVVVNDSLVLVDFVNKKSKEGISASEAACQGGVARFRAIILTSLTTFGGLMPLLFEKSTQAQFLIPMAVSLGFGILFATVITLILVPINYLILEDFKNSIKNIFVRNK